MFPIEFSVLAVQLCMIEVGLSYFSARFYLRPVVTEFSHLFASTYAVNCLKYKTFENMSVVTCCVVWISIQFQFNPSTVPLPHICKICSEKTLQYLHMMYVGVANCAEAPVSRTDWIQSLLYKYLRNLYYFGSKDILDKGTELDSARLLSAACICCSSAHASDWIQCWSSLCTYIYLLLFSLFCLKPIISIFRRWRNSIRCLGHTCTIGNGVRLR